MAKMVKFRATEKGYYNDIIHDPDTDRHVLFDAPEDLQCSWAERVNGEAAAEVPAEVSSDTLAAEAVLDAEADAAAPIVANESQADPDESDDVPADAGEPEDVNEATGVEVL